MCWNVMIVFDSSLEVIVFFILVLFVVFSTRNDDVFGTSIWKLRLRSQLSVQMKPYLMFVFLCQTTCKTVPEK